MKRYKIEVCDAEDSIIVQQHAFELGYTWGLNHGQNVRDEVRYFFLGREDEDDSSEEILPIYYCSNADTFHSDTAYEEIDVDDFLGIKVEKIERPAAVGWAAPMPVSQVRLTDKRKLLLL